MTIPIIKKAISDKMDSRLEPVIVPTTANTRGPATDENLLDKLRKPKNSAVLEGGTRLAYKDLAIAWLPP